MGKRKIAAVWDGEHFEILNHAVGKPAKARCKLCTRWVQLANGHRMLEHLRKVHPHVLPQDLKHAGLKVELAAPGVLKIDSGFSQGQKDIPRQRQVCAGLP